MAQKESDNHATEAEYSKLEQSNETVDSEPAAKKATQKPEKKKATAKKSSKKKVSQTARNASISESKAKSKKASVKKTARTTKSKMAGKTLVIVESPSKARTINKYLGNKFVIEASMGHIIDLPKSRMAVDVENNFEPEFITVRGRAPILNKLKKLSSTASRVLLAPDPDREGEAISWHLARVLGKENADIKRIEFNEITKEAVEQAVQNPREIDESLVQAQQARRILDRLVGYGISPLLWKKIKRGLSAGRVQSVALKLICEREEQIDKFVPEEYWTVDVKLARGKNSFKAALHSVLSEVTLPGKTNSDEEKVEDLILKPGKKIDLKNQNQVDSLIADLEQQTFTVASVKTRERKRQPTAPYTTSRLQQDAANKLGYTSQKTMMVAQQLYEGIELADKNITGLITYMRTDSARTSPAALERLRSYIKENLGDEYLSENIRSYKSGKSAQDAHEAVRPTDPYRTPESLQSILTRDQFRLYQLIWQKFVSSQMTDEISDNTSVDIHGGNLMFRASGRSVKFAGFASVFSTEEKKKKEDLLPVLEEGEKVNLQKVLPEQHFTQPPARFTDASMVKTLEESGVGRPSTYAPTINTLLKRFYVSRLQKALKPTELGKLVNKVMVENFQELINYQFTARMEEELDQIARSEMDWVDMLRTFYGPFSGLLSDALENIDEMRNLLDEETDRVCEKCGSKMVKRIGRYGYFLACSGFPECRNAKAVPLGPCPLCDGDVVQRATKKGRPFFGCSNYPTCEFSTWDKPIENRPCPECGKLLLEKTSRERGRYIACSSCEYEEAEVSA